MPIPAGLKQDEINELLYAQLQTINAVLSAIVPGFNSDLESFATAEIDGAAGLTAAARTALKAELASLKTKHKKK